MRAVDSAIWTSGEPVSLAARLCSAISLPLTSFSTAKLGWQVYVGPASRRFAGPSLIVRAIDAPGPAKAPLVRTIDGSRVTHGRAPRCRPNVGRLRPATRQGHR